MSKTTRHPVRRTAAGVLAGALALSGAVAAAAPASAGPGFALDRVAGNDRYETSAAIAAQFGATSGAILASGETGRSVDALSANFLAGVRGVPVLLTQRDRVPASVMARLHALTGAKNVTIVGGTVAVSAAVETQLRGMGFTVTRLGGSDRYATSEEIIKAGASAASPIGLVASGTSFPDALAGGPLSYKGKHPVFLTSGGGLPQDTIDAMVAAGTRQVIILGGTTAVPASVASALQARGITVLTRLGGAGRSETSRLIADYLITNQGFTNTTFNVASGVPRGEGVDALSGAALSGKENRALLVTDNVTSAAPVVAFASARAATLNAVGDIFGGPAAVAVALEAAIELAGRTAANNQTFTATVGAAAATVVGGAVSQFTVNVGTASAVDIQLFSCSNVTTAPSGATSFTGTNPGGTGNVAVPGTVGSTISVVNGVAGASANQVVPQNGAVSFSVTANASDECVVAVVFADADGDDRLDLGANGQPSEAFGLGGRITVRATEAAAGSIAQTGVTRVELASDFFQTGTGADVRSFLYVANRDAFRLAGAGGTTTVLTAAEFEARLSVGDTVTGIYNPTQGSTFTLTDTAPVAPSTVGVRDPQGTNAGRAGIEVTFNDSGSATVASYNVLRATATESSVIGQAPVCPDPSTTAGAAAYTVVGTVADVTSPSTYVFFDATATPPAAGQTGPQYCYAVQAVDRTGDVGALSARTDARTASAAAASAGALTFVANGTAVTAARTINVRYNTAVNAATVAANGADFRVTSTTGGVSTNIPVASAAPGSAGTDVVITTAADLPAGTTITVTSQAGADGNTVCAGSATTNCQPAGQVVQVADADAPGLATAVANTARTAVVLTYDEAVRAFGANADTFDATQFTYRPDCATSVGGVGGNVARTSGTSVTFTLASGTVTAGDVDDCVVYGDSNTAADTGDVVDTAGNQQASNDSAFVATA